VDLAAGKSAVEKARAFELVELGQDGARLAGGSRPAAYALLEEAFTEAGLYRRDPAGFTKSHRPMFTRSDFEALEAVVEGRMLLLAHVERASDIKQVLALRSHYPNLRLVLLGAAEGWLVASDIARARVPVIASALTDLPEEPERIAATESNVGRLERAGVRVAISTINMTEPIQQRRLNQLAGNLVAIGRLPGMTGLSWGEAFATITSRPAEMLGLDGELGSLRPGRRADIVIWTGDPLELKSAPEAIFIDGQAQPSASRQSDLLRRYSEAGTSALPAAYRR
jgi:imidazolonepropionase-like amidohydrolase